MSSSHSSQKRHDHFHGKDPLQHIVEVQAEGMEASLEIHGAETPGVRFSFLDAARDTAVAIGLIALSLDFFEHSRENCIAISLTWGISWSFWKGARSTWLSWMRLDRLHRIASEEKNEIETNREQEREELIALYSAKGFQGDLLIQVVDVLMADQERLLRVMLQEEMGFRLNENQHPLFMGLGAFLGAMSTTILGTMMVAFLSPLYISICTIGISFFLGALYAYWEKNSALKAGCWSAMITAVIFSVLVTSMHVLIN